MAFPYEIDESFIKEAEEGFDYLIIFAGKICRLVYPPVLVDCLQCIYDPIGKKSSGRYRDGSIIPGGICHLCGGVGKKASEASENIKMTIDWKPTNWEGMPIPVRVPAGFILTRGFIVDLPKIKRATEMYIIGATEPYSKYKYVLESEPVDPFQFVPGKYFAALWKRAG